MEGPLAVVMADYEKLIDAETWSFIERANSFCPPDAMELTVEEQRTFYDRMCLGFHAGYPDGVTAETTSILLPDRAIPIRIYRTPAPEARAMLLYFHGGSFMLGGLESHDDICAELSAGTDYEVVCVDYRLLPEHPHPAAFDDAMAAFEWAATTYTRPILLCGDSAGGNLAAAVSHATRGHQRRPTGQVLIYPGLGSDRSRGSYVTHSNAPMLTTRETIYAMEMRAGGRDVSGDITFSPLADASFANLPATVILTAECDPVSSDGEAYRDRILADEGKAIWLEEKGLVHSYLRARHSVARARAGFDRVVDALNALGRGKMPDF